MEIKQFAALVSLTRQYQPEALAAMELALVTTLAGYTRANHSEGIANTEAKLKLLREK